MVVMKICTKCKIEKPAGEFYKDSRLKTGLTSACKQCRDAVTKNYASTEDGKKKRAAAQRRYAKHCKVSNNNESTQ